LPGYLELADVRAIDLRQCRVARSQWIAAVRWPIGVLSSQASCEEEDGESTDSCGGKSAGQALDSSSTKSANERPFLARPLVAP
jgi:hypothetical protein